MAKPAKKASDDVGFIPDETKAGTDDLGFVPDPEQEQPGSTWLQTGKTALQGAGKILDVARGSTTAPLLAMGLEALTGKDVYRGKEQLDAINPTNLNTYPSSAELFERAGVPPGARVSDYLSMVPKDSFADVTLRGTGGLATDIAIDPLSWLSFGGSTGAKGALQEALPKTAEALKAPSTGVTNVGKKIYSWGITPLEQAGERRGKDAAETLYKYGVRGSARKMEGQIGEVAGKLKSDRDAILKAADEVGATVDRGEAFQTFTDTLDKMVKDRRLSQEESEKILEGVIGTYLTGESPSTMLASQWKTDLNKTLPTKVWETTKGNTSVSDALQQKAGRGLKETIEKAVERNSGKEAAQKLIEKNSDLGDLLTIMPSAERYKEVQDRLRLLGHWDVGMGAGTGMMTGDMGKGLSMLAMKKAVDVGRLPSVRTNIGYGLRKLGESPVTGSAIDILTRRLVTGARKTGDENGETKK